MLELEVFVLEIAAVDGSSACAIVVREVAALKHELRDDTMKYTPCTCMSKCIE